MESIDHIDEATRNLMFQLWSRGVGVASIGQTFGESREVVEAVLETEKKKGQNPFDQDPIEVIHDHFIRIDALSEDSASLVRKESGAVRATGLALQFKLAEHRLELCQVIGVLPPPDKVRHWATGITMVNGMFDLLEERGVLDVDLIDAIQSKFASTREFPRTEDEQDQAAACETEADDDQA